MFAAKFLKLLFRTPNLLLTCVLTINFVIACLQLPARGDSGASETPKVFTLQSSDFGNGALIPTQFTADGKNISPSLQWSDAPNGTQTFAIIVSDPDAPTAQPFIHWVIFNIPAATDQLPEGVQNQGTLDQPDGALQGNNSFGQVGYGGPSPPPGPAHHYHFAIYALDTTMNSDPGCSADDLKQEMQGHILGQTEFVARYGR